MKDSGVNANFPEVLTGEISEESYNNGVLVRYFCFGLKYLIFCAQDCKRFIRLMSRLLMKVGLVKRLMWAEGLLL